MSLPDRYRVFVRKQNNTLRSATAANVSLSNTIEALLKEEAALSSTKYDYHQPNRALFASRGGRGGRGARRASPRFQKWRGGSKLVGGNSFGSSSSSKKLICHWCQIPGHVEADCRKKRVGEPKKPAPPESNTVTKQKNQATTILTIYLAHTMSSKHSWFMDSRASASICHCKKSFVTDKVAKVGQFVLLGDESGLAIVDQEMWK